MKIQTIKDRFRVYLVVLTCLYFFSQIFSNEFATYNMVAYIIAAINGIVTIEAYFLLKPLQGVIFVKMFWLIYIVRVVILFFVIVIYAAVKAKTQMADFFAAFFVNYFTWITIELIILVKDRENEKFKV